MAFLETMAKLIERYNSFFTEGIVNTLIIAAFSVLFGAILGTLMASLRMCRIPPPAVDRSGVHRVCPRNAADGAAHVYLLRSAYDRHYHS